MATIRLLIGRLRRDQLPGLLIVGLVFVTALLAASAPRLFNRVADAGLRHQVAGASVVERNLELGRIWDYEAGLDDGMRAIDEVEAEIRAGLPPSIDSVISNSATIAESVVFSILHSPPTRPGFLTLHFQDRTDDLVRLVEGRMPSGEVELIPAPELPPASVPIPDDLQAPLFEVALSTITADELGVGVGDRLEMVPDTNDPLVGTFGILQPVVVDIVGLIEVVDPAADIWVGDRGLHEPAHVPVGINIVLVYGTALVSPDAYPYMLGLDPMLRYRFRYEVDPERFDAGMLDDLVVDLQRMEATYPAFATGPDPLRTTLQTGLLELTERFRAERRTTEAVLTTAAIGPGAVAIAAIGVLALLAMSRRRQSLILLRGRGGSAPQIVGSHLVEGLLLAVAPSAAAALLAVALVDARATPLTAFAAGIVALGTILVIGAASLPTALSPLRRLEREAPAAIGASPRRLAFEGLAVGLAIGGVVLLRQRGLAGGSAAGQLAGVDPFLAAVPALVGLAVGIVTVRLYPYPIRAAGWVAASGRGLVPALGLRRAERQSGMGQLPLIVLLLTVAIGTFSSTMLATIDRGQVVESWQSVGAAHRLTGSDPLLGLDVSEIPGVEAVARAHVGEASVGLAGTGHVGFVALDVDEYLDVTDGTPAAASLPAEFTDPPPVSEDRLGTDDNPVPAIVTRELARTSTTPLAVGDTVVLTIRARFATFRVVDIRDVLPGGSAGRAGIVVPRAMLIEAIPDRPFEATSLFVRAPAEVRAALIEAAAAAGGGISVVSQEARLASLRERPLVDAVRTGFALALVAAVAYAAMAVIIALLLAGLARARETAHLRTLGIGRMQVALLAVIEHAPPVLVALVGGLLLGVAVAWVVLPGLQLGAFTGSGADPALIVDIGQLVLLTEALLLIVAVGVALAAWAQRRADPARAIRSGIE